MQNEIEMSQVGFNGIVRDMRQYAGEDVRVRFFSGAIWVFGSELATLRLFKRNHNRREGVVQGFSSNYNAHYFKYELSGVYGERDTLEG